jgi:serine/threonine protein kinase
MGANTSASTSSSGTNAKASPPAAAAAAAHGAPHPHWLPPEAAPDAAPSSAADTWALGVLMLQLAAGQPAHDCDDEEGQPDTRSQPAPGGGCCLVWSLVRRLTAEWDPDAATVCCPADRDGGRGRSSGDAPGEGGGDDAPRTAGDVLRSLPQSFADMAAQCLSRDPRGRPSVGALLRHPFVADYSGYGQRDFQRWMNDILRKSL